MSESPTMLEQLLAAMDDTKQVIREAHEAAKDLRQATREAREAARALQRDEFEPFLREEVDKAAEQIREDGQRAVKDASDRVISRFERLSNLLMYGNEQGRGEGLEPAIRRVAAERHPDGGGT
jgi:vacuolar-type H+-ATPase subunit H